MNFKWTLACAMGGLMALTTPSKALTGTFAPHVQLDATVNSSSTSDESGDNPNPYAIITDRNIFRLNPPPPPPVAEQKPADVPKVYLNGIIKVAGNVRVLFSIPAKDAKSQTSYFKLAPGERATGESDNVLELLRIHPDEQEVDVVVNGTVETLSVLSNSMASTGVRGGGAPPPASAVAAAAPSESSAIIAGGGGRSSSPYGGVSVGGGGGSVAVIGGNNSASLGSSGGVTVGGGGNNSGGGAGSQIANVLFSGTPNQGQIGDPSSSETVASPENQALALLKHNAQDPDGPPLPPPLAEMVGQNTGGLPSKGTSPVSSGMPGLPGLP